MAEKSTFKQAQGRTDRQTDGQSDGQTDGQTDEQTDRHIFNKINQRMVYNSLHFKCGGSSMYTN